MSNFLKKKIFWSKWTRCSPKLDETLSLILFSPLQSIVSARNASSQSLSHGIMTALSEKQLTLSSWRFVASHQKFKPVLKGIVWIEGHLKHSDRYALKNCTRRSDRYDLVKMNEILPKIAQVIGIAHVLTVTLLQQTSPSLNDAAGNPSHKFHATTKQKTRAPLHCIPFGTSSS